jgi:glycosyltransferase involved in cell wall biosynthesis
MNGLHLIKWPVMVDRRAGFSSRSFIASTKPGSLFDDEDFDVVCEARGWRKDEWHWRGLIDFFLHADVWVAFFDSLFFPLHAWKTNEWVMKTARIVGIQTIMAPHGMDIFYRDGRVNRYDWVGRAQHDYPDWDLTGHRRSALRRTRMWCRYARMVIASNSPCYPFLPRRDVSFLWFPVDCESLRPSESKEETVASSTHESANRPPVVIHAPQHRSIKGTDYLLASKERLNLQGIPIELRLMERVARADALRLYREADIIADQFCMGSYGMFALEGLALGKAVLTYLDQETLSDPVFDLPVINTNPQNLDAVLAVLLQVPELRLRIGRAGRRAVERYQSLDALAEVWTQIYNHVWWGKPLRLESTQHFSSRRRARAFTEDPSCAEFWPVPVHDLMPEISAALERVGAAAYRPAALV